MKTTKNQDPIDHRLLDKVVDDYREPYLIPGTNRTRRTWIGRQRYGNRNYVIVEDTTVPSGYSTLVGGEGAPKLIARTIYDNGRTYTVYTKDSSCKRGEYAEELDIQLGNRFYRRGTKALVTRIAKAVLEAEYEEGLRVSKVKEQFGLFF